tara:strand:- start:267 stop:1037 length:771 start_codon:yes stop_codon:yes gene_type:complete
MRLRSRKNMKGIILAGGTGSRLYPLTSVTNKHLLPVGDKPMILHSVKKLVDVGIDDIMIITGTEHMGDMISLLGSGKKYNCKFTYKVQDEPDGIAGALLLCEDFVSGNDMCVLLGDNIFKESLQDAITVFKESNPHLPKCVLNLVEVDDPTRFGVPTIKNNQIIEIIEKPRKPNSKYCVTGIYLYDNRVFDFIKSLKKSKRGEYEITDVNNSYIQNGKVMYNIFKSWWTDAGTHASYQNANRRYFFDSKKRHEYDQ